MATATSTGSARGTHSGTSGGQSLPDVTYNLVSVLYHAMQGCETYEQYAQDADQAGQQEVAQFFREVAQENQQRAQRGQQLLHQCLMQGGQAQGGRASQLHSSGTQAGQQSSGSSGTQQMPGNQQVR